jgi:TusA-related sulfurtransferase
MVPPGERNLTERAGEVDLRGIPCPLNWAKAKVRLETLGRGEHLAFLIDDRRSVRDMPRAAEAEGYVVTDLTELGDCWRLVIET